MTLVMPSRPSRLNRLLTGQRVQLGGQARRLRGAHADRREQAGQRRLRGQRQLPGGVAVQIDEQLPVRELRPEQVRDVNG
jgi:hypothetical protein